MVCCILPLLVAKLGKIEVILECVIYAYRMPAPLKPWSCIRNNAAFLDILDAK